MNGNFLHSRYIANSIKVALQKTRTVNYKRACDDGLLPIFTSKGEIISLKQHRGHIVTRMSIRA